MQTGAPVSSGHADLPSRKERVRVHCRMIPLATSRSYPALVPQTARCAPSHSAGTESIQRCPSRRKIARVRIGRSTGRPHVVHCVAGVDGHLAYPVDAACLDTPLQIRSETCSGYGAFSPVSACDPVASRRGPGRERLSSSAEFGLEEDPPTTGRAIWTTRTPVTGI